MGNFKYYDDGDSEFDYFIMIHCVFKPSTTSDPTSTSGGVAIFTARNRLAQYPRRQVAVETEAAEAEMDSGAALTHPPDPLSREIVDEQHKDLLALY